MNSKVLIVALLVGFTLACDTRPLTEFPEFPDGGIVKDARPIPPESLQKIDGLLEAENLGFGFPVVMHGTRFGVSLFGDVNSAYARLDAGCLDNRLIMEGISRQATNTTTGLIRLELLPTELATAICNGENFELEAYEDVRLVGKFGEESLDQRADFSYVAPLFESDFQILSHRGGCRTIDECGYSENSVENLLNAEKFGATGTEVDIIITKDGVPILYHDAAFTSRLVQGSHCVGAVADYTYEQIQGVCRLEYGEAIPTLEGALEAVVYDTQLQRVWLDTKTPDVVDVAIDTSIRFNEIAQQEGRNLVVGLGLPTESVYEEFQKRLKQRRAEDPDFDVPCLVELEPDQVRDVDCNIWGPRFTLGPQQKNIRDLEDDGIGTYYWTVNRQQDIDVMLTESAPRGILSDRVHLVMQRYQALAYEGRLYADDEE